MISIPIFAFLVIHLSGHGAMMIFEDDHAHEHEIHHEAKFELTLVEQAINRVESNEYGICSLCTEAINPERLKILP